MIALSSSSCLPPPPRGREGGQERSWLSSPVCSVSSCLPPWWCCCCSGRPLLRRWLMPPQRQECTLHPEGPESPQQMESALAFLVECIYVISPVQFIVQQRWEVTNYIYSRYLSRFFVYVYLKWFLKSVILLLLK